MKENNGIYERVRDRLIAGVPIYKSLKREGMNATRFYNMITPEQKDQLSLIRALNKTCGCKTPYGLMGQDTANFQIIEP
jgi:hypothetical protein